ncbi:glycine cleavage system H-protein subunit [Puccinia graminis f. sp. tritici]|uniref:Glycine cleavage system H protein n=1 Tax=Puccinia graminis f. sp. tritici TaxID=56615 RepID=A0A5B0LTQ4_PUCGR|nr:glycine cleavage system H-protein subunit [Puccinia graminis f. sp. tritici]KAA1071517.1 glycine cleavage system H-protein subunit [Puccinia graminis f. sp. tritici]
MSASLLRPVFLSCRVSIPAYSLNSLSRVSSIGFKRFVSTKRYTKEHEWVSLDPKTNVGTIGITDYAQNSLGDVVFVELPEVSATVSSGELIGAVESVKAASDIFAPVSGTVTEVNTKLADQAGLLNKSPEDEGWLAKIQLSSPQELDNLLSEESYKAHIEGEH